MHCPMDSNKTKMFDSVQQVIWNPTLFCLLVPLTSVTSNTSQPCVRSFAQLTATWYPFLAQPHGVCPCTCMA